MRSKKERLLLHSLFLFSSLLLSDFLCSCLSYSICLVISGCNQAQVLVVVWLYYWLSLLLTFFITKWLDPLLWILFVLNVIRNFACKVSTHLRFVLLLIRNTCVIYLCTWYLFIYKEFQPIIGICNDFGVGRDWILDFLFKDKRLYQLN